MIRPLRKNQNLHGLSIFKYIFKIFDLNKEKAAFSSFAQGLWREVGETFQPAVLVFAMLNISKHSSLTVEHRVGVSRLWPFYASVNFCSILM